MRPWLTRERQRLEGLKSELEQVRRAYADDSEAQQQAVKEFYEHHRLNPARSCLPHLLGAAVMQAPVLWLPMSQTVPERLAGIVVVRD